MSILLLVLLSLLALASAAAGVAFIRDTSPSTKLIAKLPKRSSVDKPKKKSK